MALTNIQLVRYGIGDVDTPYIISDSVITDYLTLNDDDVNDTIDDLQPVVLAILATRSGRYRTEDLEEDTTDKADNYSKALEKINNLKASSAYPIFGGSSSTEDDLSVGVDMFDEENQYDSSNNARTSGTFYNGIENI